MIYFDWDEIRRRNLLVIEGVVYDLSAYKDKHPGGASVLERFAGSDATIVFNAVRHSSRAILEMKKYVVGLLRNDGQLSFVNENL